MPLARLPPLGLGHPWNLCKTQSTWYLSLFYRSQGTIRHLSVNWGIVKSAVSSSVLDAGTLETSEMPTISAPFPTSLQRRVDHAQCRTVNLRQE